MISDIYMAQMEKIAKSEYTYGTISDALSDVDKIMGGITEFSDTAMSTGKDIIGAGQEFGEKLKNIGENMEDTQKSVRVLGKEVPELKSSIKGLLPALLPMLAGGFGLPFALKGLFGGGQMSPAQNGYNSGYREEGGYEGYDI